MRAASTLQAEIKKCVGSKCMQLDNIGTLLYCMPSQDLIIICLHKVTTNSPECTHLIFMAKINLGN